jgi:NAD(P)-dependent dehydrogenase (short-subunit alcohol dehydrogenase family)
VAVEHLREGTSIVSSGSVPGISRPLWLRFYTATKGAVDGPTSVFAAAVAPDEIGNIAVLLASGDTLRAADKIGPCPRLRGACCATIPLDAEPVDAD